MAQREVAGGDEAEDGDGTSTRMLEPQGTTAWLLYFTSMKLPDGSSNKLGTALHALAGICMIPTCMLSAQIALSRDCNGKGNILVVCSFIFCLMYELVIIFSYCNTSDLTASQHVYSYATKAEGDRQWRHLHTWWQRMRFMYIVVEFLKNVIVN